jgi:hypothetical protein
MPTLSIANPADRIALSRRAYKIVADNEPAMTEAQKKAATKKRNGDALNHVAMSDALAGDNIEIDSVSAEALAPEIGGERRLAQERSVEINERKAAEKLRAAILGAELAPHTNEMQSATVAYLELSIKHPTSDRELAMDVALLAHTLKRLKLAKFFEDRIAPLLNISKRSAERLRSQIKVVHEDINDGRDREFSQAKELLGKAARVHLLGFGFGARNVQRLGIADLAPHAFSGTSFGLTEREKANCQKLCGGKVNLLGNQSLEFLRNFVELS